MDDILPSLLAFLCDLEENEVVAHNNKKLPTNNVKREAAHPHIYYFRRPQMFVSGDLAIDVVVVAVVAIGLQSQIPTTM